MAKLLVLPDTYHLPTTIPMQCEARSATSRQPDMEGFGGRSRPPIRGLGPAPSMGTARDSSQKEPDSLFCSEIHNSFHLNREHLAQTPDYSGTIEKGGGW